MWSTKQLKYIKKKTIKVQSSDVLVVLMGFASTVSFFFFLFKLSDGQIMVARASDVKTSF